MDVVTNKIMRWKIMKKWIVFMLTMVMVCSLTACGSR